MVDEFVEACLSLGLEGKAAQAGSLLVSLEHLAGEVDHAHATSRSLIEQAHAISRRLGASTKTTDALAPEGDTPVRRRPSAEPSGIPAPAETIPPASTTTTDPAPAWAQAAGQRLPVRPDGSPTHGLTFDAAGNPLDQDAVVSGTDRTIIDGLALDHRERRAASLTSHVEAKVAARIRRRELPARTVLVLNHRPCKGPLACQAIQLRAPTSVSRSSSGARNARHHQEMTPPRWARKVTQVNRPLSLTRYSWGRSKGATSR